MAREQVAKYCGPQSPKKESADLVADRELHTLLDKEHAVKRKVDIFLLSLILILILFLIL